MNRWIVSASIATSLILGIAARPAAAPAGSRPVGMGEAEALERAATFTQSPEVFGETVLRQLLLTSAKKLREGKTDRVTVSLDFRVSVTPIPTPRPPSPPIPPPPSPEEIDVCWEMCPVGNEGFLQCYVDCSGPHLPSSPVHLRTCDDIWRDYEEAATVPLKLKYMLELLARGCVEDRAVHIEVQRTPK